MIIDNRARAADAGLRLAAALLALTLAACATAPLWPRERPADYAPPRPLRPADIVLPPGYAIEAVASGLDFPGGVAFDEQGRPHVIEAGDALAGLPPRLLRLDADGRRVEIARGGRNGPWTGVTAARGVFFIAEGGRLEGGRILRVNRDGTVQTLVSGLPSYGDHPTRGPALGPDGALYFGQGTATNAGVVGPDNAEWLARTPQFHDVACRELQLSGQNFRSPDPRDHGGDAITGGFAAMGTTTRRGQRLRGRLPCSGAVFRIGADGGALRLVAWGLRDPAGLAFSPDGVLHVAERSYEERGSRAVVAAPDLLWALHGSLWHGWPDYAGGLALGEPPFRQPGKAALRPLLTSTPNPPPTPLLRLAPGAEPGGLDFSRSERFGHVGEAFVALFGGRGDQPGGFQLLRVDPRSGSAVSFARNREDTPAWRNGGGGLERPIDARFSPDGSALYVVDYGVLLEAPARPQPGTGVLWRIRRQEAVARR